LTIEFVKVCSFYKIFLIGWPQEIVLTKSIGIKMIIFGVTVACYFLPIILSCAIYFALIFKKKKIQENNILEENLNQITTTKVILKHSAIEAMEEKLENHFEIPGVNFINIFTYEFFVQTLLQQLFLVTF